MSATAMPTPAAKQPKRSGAAAAGNKRGNNNNNNKPCRNERNILTFYEKIAVIRYYDETNISRNSLAKMFHCCATQIRRILEKKRELLQQLATLSEADASIIIEEMTRKRRKFEMSAISFLLHEWVERCRLLRHNTIIGNQQLKETALSMAVLLNLPAFRPSYRWLNRFRAKYKYDEVNIGYTGESAVNEQLPVEHIIYEFKHALPNFMQKEIGDDGEADEQTNGEGAANTELVLLSSENNSEISGVEDLERDKPNAELAICEPSIPCVPLSPAMTPTADLVDDNERSSFFVNAGTCTLLNTVFPHLAIIHQFALMNSDVQALQLISQLGVHMQQQATSGAYSGLTLANDGLGENELPRGSILADIDDIELIE